MTEHRWSKFWWQDWQADQALRSCGLAARGLWIDMLCIAHNGTPRGYVTINGAPVSPKRLATLTGTTEKEIVRLLAELREAGVFSVTDDGVIFSRRMVRDTDASEAGREAVGRRWEKARDPITPPNSPPTVQPSTLEAEAEAEAERPSLRSGRAREANGSRLPDDWQPAEPGYDGATPVTLAKFRDYWRAQPGAKGRKADWDATWRNWCRRDAEQPKPKLHTLPPGEQDRRILAAVGLNFTDPPPPARVPILPLRAVK